MPEGRVFVIPVKLSDCEVPEKFSRLHWSNLYETGALERIVRSIQTYMTEFQLARSALDAAETPLDALLDRAREGVRAANLQLLQVSADILHKYTAFLSDAASGVTKLLPEGKYEDVSGIRHGVSWFSSVRRSHELNNEANIALTKRGGSYELSLAFKGRDYGFFVHLGDIPIEDISNGECPPEVLPEEAKLAWSYAWAYSPPLDVKRVRAEGYKFRRGVRVGAITLTERAPATVGRTLLVRSLVDRHSDILIAIRTEEALPDGTITLVWKILKQFEKPHSVGPEPYGFDVADILAAEFHSELSAAIPVALAAEEEYIKVLRALHPKTITFLRRLSETQLVPTCLNRR